MENILSPKSPSPVAQSEECLLNTQEVPGSKPGRTIFFFFFPFSFSFFSLF